MVKTIAARWRCGDHSFASTTVIGTSVPSGSPQANRSAINVSIECTNAVAAISTAATRSDPTIKSLRPNRSPSGPDNRLASITPVAAALNTIPKSARATCQCLMSCGATSDMDRMSNPSTNCTNRQSTRTRRWKLPNRLLSTIWSMVSVVMVILYRVFAVPGATGFQHPPVRQEWHRRRCPQACRGGCREPVSW